ncbi:hypothetical protein DFH29DRAFT_966534 [Suillus ampliporus]|nr:hypothetical protein DFH29DRAFT_966534 [Suillus ampliporus]
MLTNCLVPRCRTVKCFMIFGSKIQYYMHTSKRQEEPLASKTICFRCRGIFVAMLLHLLFPSVVLVRGLIVHQRIVTCVTVTHRQTASCHRQVLLLLSMIFKVFAVRQGKPRAMVVVIHPTVCTPAIRDCSRPRATNPPYHKGKRNAYGLMFKASAVLLPIQSRA